MCYYNSICRCFVRQSTSDEIKSPIRKDTVITETLKRVLSNASFLNGSVQDYLPQLSVILTLCKKHSIQKAPRDA